MTYTVDFTALLTDEGNTEEPGTETEPTAQSVTITSDAENDTLSIGGKATLTASVTMSDESTYGGNYTWAITSGNDVITLDADANGATVTVTALKSGTATVTVTVGNGVSSEVFTITVSLPSDSVSFAAGTDENPNESYSWIKTVDGVYKTESDGTVGETTAPSNGVVTSDGSTSTDGLITIVGTSGLTEGADETHAYTISSTPMTIGSGYLTTAGASSSSQRYISINLSDYAGKYVSISVEVSGTGTNNQKTKTVFLGTERYSSSSTTFAGNTILYVKTESSNDHQTLTYVGMVAENCSVLYISWDDSVRIYTIEAGILETATPTVIATTVSLTAAATSLVVNDETNGSTTLMVTITGEDGGTYASGYSITWTETPTTEGDSVIEISEDEDGNIVVTAKGAGTAEITVEVWYAGSSLECTPVTITVTGSASDGTTGDSSN